MRPNQRITKPPFSRLEASRASKGLLFGVALILVVAACGEAPTTDVDPADRVAPAPTTPPSPQVTDRAAEFGCDPSVVRAAPMPARESWESLSPEAAKTAPELHPGRLAYIIDAGGNARAYDPTEAEMAAVDAYWEMSRLVPEMRKAAKRAAGADFAGVWGSGLLSLVFATAGDRDVVEAALAGYPVDLEVVQATFSKRQLVAWTKAIREQAGETGAAVTASVSEPENIVEISVVHGSTVDLSQVPCAAVKVNVAGDVTSAVAYAPDLEPPPNQTWLLEARPQAVRPGSDVSYGPESAPCAEVGVWAGGTWHDTGLATQTTWWHSEASDVNSCNLSLTLGFSTVTVPEGTAPGWYRICLNAPQECALVEVLEPGLDL